MSKEDRAYRVWRSSTSAGLFAEAGQAERPQTSPIRQSQSPRRIDQTPIGQTSGRKSGPTGYLGACGNREETPAPRWRASGPRSGQIGQQPNAGYSLLAHSPAFRNAGPYRVDSRGPATRFRARRIVGNEPLACGIALCVQRRL